MGKIIANVGSNLKKCNMKKIEKRKENKVKKLRTSLRNSTRVPSFIKMDSSDQTSIPSVIGQFGNEEENDKTKVQQLSDLVSAVNLKSKNSKIGRLPCNYKHKRKETLSSNFTPIKEVNFKKGSIVEGIDFHVLNDSQVMLVMTSPIVLYFNGSFNIQVLMGSVEILGYLINSSSNIQTVYSTRGSSHLCIKAVSNDNIESVKNCNNLNLAISMIEKFLKGKIRYVYNILSKLTERNVVVILQKNIDKIYAEVWPKIFLQHCSSYSMFPQGNNFFKNKNRPCSAVENVLNCLFEVSSTETTPKKFQELPEWSDVEAEIILKANSLPPKTIIIGGKGVGKSTLLRYMVNKSLNKWEKVLVLDFDIGQSEFTVPGCVSAILVEKPLLGTNFTHLMDPVRSVFVGDINAVQCLGRYMEGFQQVLNFCKQQLSYQEIPWFINTMGFCKDLGVSITTSIIQQVGPTHVIQIFSCSKSKNFEKLLKAQFVNKCRFGRNSRPFATLDYMFLFVPSASESREGNSICTNEWGMQSKILRQLVLFSYFSRMLKPPSLNLLELTPYMVNISDVCLELYQAADPVHALATMNGNLVALCNKSNEVELPNCLGFGIVRAVDFIKDQLFLLTPLDESKLEDVNCLIKGNIFLPESFLLNYNAEVENHVPYVAHTCRAFCSQNVKRQFKPNKLNTGTHIKNY